LSIVFVHGPTIARGGRFHTSAESRVIIGCLDADRRQASGARKRWWTLPLQLPRWLWEASGTATDAITEDFRRRPGRWTTLAIRLSILVSFIVLLPFMPAFARRWRDTTGTAVLNKRALDLWATSPLDAIAMVRATLDQLVAAGCYEGSNAVTIDGLGKFAASDVFWVHQFLYDCEVALGRYEEALAVAAALPIRWDTNVLQQVDCLVALGRNADAIALLERSLDLDGWRGKLRARLQVLHGKPDLRVV
jgi:hypothetical protein